MQPRTLSLRIVQTLRVVTSDIGTFVPPAYSKRPFLGKRDPFSLQEPEKPVSGRFCVEIRHPIAEQWVEAHELSNDLSVIIRRCEVLGNLIERPEVAKHVNLIREAAQHMAETIARGSMSNQPRTSHTA